MTTAYTAGNTISVNTVAEIIPPTMGAAMRRITSEPVPRAEHDGEQSHHAADNGHHYGAYPMYRALATIA